MKKVQVGPGAVLTVVLVATGACSGSTQVRTTYRYAANDPLTSAAIDVRPGPMPASESFSGSFHSQQIGEVFIDQTGDAVVGTYAYDRASCHATGRIEGTAQGNFMRFTWTESQRACGRIAPLTGRGYFLFWVDSASNGRVNGEWGVGANDSGGGPWALFRDRVRRPAPPPPSTESEGAFDAPGTSSSSGSSATPAPGGAAPGPTPAPTP